MLLNDLNENAKVTSTETARILIFSKQKFEDDLTNDVQKKNAKTSFKTQPYCAKMTVQPAKVLADG